MQAARYSLICDCHLQVAANPGAPARSRTVFRPEHFRSGPFSFGNEALALLCNSNATGAILVVLIVRTSVGRSPEPSRHAVLRGQA
jgi:hypothetical protein